MGEPRWLREPPQEPGNYPVADLYGTVIALWPREAYFSAFDKWSDWAAQWGEDTVPLWVWSESVDLPAVPVTCGPCSLSMHDECFRKSGDGDCACPCAADWRVFIG